ncbi:C-type lectin domain family 2 member D2 isoform X2 [Chelonia mydas]|uniref:C-type lectin domain family 2 member D2 isoform X2 n=1 Tax=Chelonia mydas TaxID=8469 RepID=UPI001CA9CAEE|nr:C-type lectin domain family 2 member D2 isoform X2 [Chelonia mydas]
MHREGEMEQGPDLQGVLQPWSPWRRSAGESGEGTGSQGQALCLGFAAAKSDPLRPRGADPSPAPAAASVARVSLRETMGPAAGAAESEEPLQELCVNGNGHRETGGNPDPPCNCQKSLTCGVVVALIVVSSALIAAIIALAVLASKLSSADLCPPAGPSCPDGWMGYRGKCYYFSETEGSWTDSRSRCSAPGASLAGIDSEQEMVSDKRRR